MTFLHVAAVLLVTWVGPFGLPQAEVAAVYYWQNDTDPMEVCREIAKRVDPRAGSATCVPVQSTGRAT
jgi:hypothetical protein